MKLSCLFACGPSWKYCQFILVLLLLSGCGGDGSVGAGMTPVTISFAVPVAQMKPSYLPSDKQIMLAVQDGDTSLLQQYSHAFADILIPDATAAPVPTGLASVVVTITGAGMATIMNTFAVSAGQTVSHTFSVPSGVNRNFLVQAFSGLNGTGEILFQGNTLVADLQVGVPVTLSVPMLVPTLRTITVTVTDALTLVPVSGLVLSLRGVVTTTNAVGMATVKASPGHVSVMTSHSSYVGRNYPYLLGSAVSALRIFVYPVSAGATDSDGDGLPDAVESNTGIYLSALDTGSDPMLADTDADGIDDGTEVLR